MNIAGPGYCAAKCTTSIDASCGLIILKPRRLPLGLLRSHNGVLEANNERARDVFLRVLRHVNDEVAWQVFVTFDPNHDNYWVNVRALSRD